MPKDPAMIAIMTPNRPSRKRTCATGDTWEGRVIQDAVQLLVILFRHPARGVAC